ncbi:hypothetical protein A4R35_01775 [Thermogemmatispora tikiterensis]|uniref:Uncharacterized protein n=1 Tax=Thermogemmatispora tikiterensis TaxID=1825093 RepID=A0A328VBV2_9CHLR|nr:hypothetical protein A4R35_01775 [Thermogemmatispora tikiterensis]
MPVVLGAGAWMTGDEKEWYASSEAMGAASNISDRAEPALVISQIAMAITPVIHLTVLGRCSFTSNHRAALLLSEMSFGMVDQPYSTAQAQDRSFSLSLFITQPAIQHG